MFARPCVLDPDPNWIRIRQLCGPGSVFRILIWIHTIQNKKKYITYSKKIHFLFSELSSCDIFCTVIKYNKNKQRIHWRKNKTFFSKIAKFSNKTSPQKPLKHLKIYSEKQVIMQAAAILYDFLYSFLYLQTKVLILIQVTDTVPAK